MLFCFVLLEFLRVTNDILTVWRAFLSDGGRTSKIAFSAQDVNVDVNADVKRQYTAVWMHRRLAKWIDKIRSLPPPYRFVMRKRARDQPEQRLNSSPDKHWHLRNFCYRDRTSIASKGMSTLLPLLRLLHFWLQLSWQQMFKWKKKNKTGGYNHCKMSCWSRKLELAKFKTNWERWPSSGTQESGKKD